MSDDYISEVFGAEGLFASHWPNYEARKGQVELARTIDEGMQTSRHVLAEGPCGVGKAVAYAVPAVWHARRLGRRVVIATANIALQEQLVFKDLPMLAKILPWEFTFALLKGRNNFLCVRRLHELKLNRELETIESLEQRHQAEVILRWAETTSTGDVSELPFVPIAEVWSYFSVGSEECLGDACSLQTSCHSERAKAVAARATIVVTNIHMLCAHLAVREVTGKDLVLPSFDRLVIDEAHEMANIARDFFGFTVSESTMWRLAKAAERIATVKHAKELRRKAKEFFDAVTKVATAPESERRLTTPEFVDDAELRASLLSLEGIAESRALDEHFDAEARVDGENIARLARQAMDNLREAITQSDADKVYWLELNARGRAKVCAKIIDVSRRLRSQLFHRCASATLISATLTTAGNFDFVRRELGVPSGALEIIVQSPFDFGSQALFVVPEDLPLPKDPDFADAVASVFTKVMDMCDGRTLGLFTSYKNLDAVYERIAKGPHRVLRQRQLPRRELTRIFKEDVGSVLLGTNSFWTGIDVPGEALTAVIIDKLPFIRRDDPVIAAICDRDPDAFQNYIVPMAVIAFRQGIGRLIRSKTDVGVVVLLDRRIADKMYGYQFIDSLPPMIRTRTLENIAIFLQRARYARAS